MAEATHLGPDQGPSGEQYTPSHLFHEAIGVRQRPEMGVTWARMSELEGTLPGGIQSSPAEPWPVSSVVSAPAGHQGVVGPIPGQGTHLGCGLLSAPRWGPCRRRPSMCVPHTNVSPLPPFHSLKKPREKHPLVRINQ